MFMRLCFILLAVSLVAKPLLTAMGGGCDCGCCGPAPDAAVLAVDAIAEEALSACCCLGSLSAADSAVCHEPQADEGNSPDDGSQEHHSGCDCPKSCCASTVKVQLATPRLQNPWPGAVEDDMKWARPFFESAFRSDGALARLDRPPRGMTAA